MLGDVFPGEGLQNRCKSIRVEEKEDLLNCALDFPTGCVSAACLLSPCVCGRANKDSAEVQIQQELHSPEATGMVVERSSVTPKL